jgi:hypothetical protein
MTTYNVVATWLGALSYTSVRQAPGLLDTESVSMTSIEWRYLTVSHMSHPNHFAVYQIMCKVFCIAV